MPSTSSMLKRFNPGKNFSTQDMVNQLMTERRELAESPQYSSPEAYQNYRQGVSQSFGSSSPRYWQDMAQGTAMAPPVDYSAYMPQEQFDIAKALEFASNVGAEDYDLVLNSMTPRMLPMKTGLAGLAETYSPMVQAGIGNANQKKDIYVQQYEKDWAEQQEQKRKIKKAEFDYAVDLYKLEKKEQLEREKMAAEEQRHQQNLAQRLSLFQAQQVLQAQKDQAAIEKENRTIENDRLAGLNKIVDKGTGFWGSMFGDSRLERAEFITKAHDNFGFSRLEAENLYNIGVKLDQLPFLKGQGASELTDNIQTDNPIEPLEPPKKKDPMFLSNDWFMSSDPNDKGTFTDKAIGTGKIAASNLLQPFGYEGLTNKIGLTDALKLTPEQQASSRLGKILQNTVGSIGDLPLGAAGAGVVGKGLKYATKAKAANRIGDGLLKGSKIWQAQPLKEAVASQLGGTAAMNAVDQYMPDNAALKPYLGFAAGVAGGAGAQGAFVNPTKRTLKGLYDNAELNPSLKAAYQNIGIEPGILQIGDAPQIKSINKTLAKTIGSKGYMRKVEKEEGDKVVKALGAFADPGYDLSKIEVGGLASKGIKENYYGTKGKLSRSYNARDQDIEDGLKKMGLNNLLVKTENTGALRDQLGQMVKEDNIVAKISKQIFDAEEKKGGIPYKQIPEFRRDIRKKIDLASIEDRGRLRKLDSALKKDYDAAIKPALAAKSKRAVQRNDILTKKYSEFKQNLEDPVDGLLWLKGQADVVGREVFDNINKDVKKTATVIKIAQDGLNKDDLTTLNHGILYHLGKGGSEGFSSIKLHTALNKLDNQAKNRLLSHLSKPEKTKFLAALDVIDSWKSKGKYANHSQTAEFLKADTVLQDLATAAQSTVSGDKKGLSKAAQIVGKAVIGKTQAKALMNPKILAALEKGNLIKKMPRDVLRTSSIYTTPFASNPNNKKESEEERLMNILTKRTAG